MFREKREKLVENLIRCGYIKSDAVKEAFLSVPREKFVPAYMQHHAYVDTPLQIGQGQTISAPHMVAIMCEASHIEQGQKVLEIGAGSGYHAAIVARLVGDSGHVYTVERFADLVAKAKKALGSIGVSNVTVHVGDGSLGWKEKGPFDRIYVTCAAPDVPKPLVDQLCDSGLLLIPVGDMFCELLLVQKQGVKTKEKKLGGCVFVPLVGRYGHQR